MRKSYTTLTEIRHGHLWVLLPDTIDMDNCQKIEENIMIAMDTAPSDVVLDLINTKMLFSSGIGLVVRLKKLIAEKGRSLFLVNIDSRIKESLENVGLQSVLEIYASEDDFVKAKA